MPTLTRRTFLAATTGALAATTLARPPAALPGAAPAPAAAKPPRFLKALKYGMIAPGATVAEKLALARDCGFDGVEMDSPTDLGIDEILKARDAAGIRIPGVVDSVHWQKTLGDPDESVRREGIAALQTALRDCKALGGTSVLLVPGVVNKRLPYADVYARSQAAIREALPLARELGIRIAIENVWNNFLLSPLEAARYTDELDPQWVGWHFDPGNVVNYAWPEHWIRALGPRIWKLDVKEFSRKVADEKGKWAGFGVEIGEGDCDWPAIVAALAEVGYGASGEAWAAAEVRGGDEARLKDIARRMDRVLNGAS